MEILSSFDLCKKTIEELHNILALSVEDGNKAFTNDVINEINRRKNISEINDTRFKSNKEKFLVKSISYYVNLANIYFRGYTCGLVLILINYGLVNLKYNMYVEISYKLILAVVNIILNQYIDKNIRKNHLYSAMASNNKMNMFYINLIKNIGIISIAFITFNISLNVYKF